LVEYVSLVVSLAALLGLVLSIGTYKAKVDRHEAVLNLLQEEAMRQLLKKGKATRSSEVSGTDFSAIPLRLKKRIDAMALTHVHAGNHCTQLMRRITNEELESIAEAGDLTMIEAMALAVLYSKRSLRFMKSAESQDSKRKEHSEEPE